MKSEGHVLGERLDDFEIVEEAGHGGFGVTYLARDLRLDRWVAIKEYLPRDWGMRLQDGTVGPRSRSDAENYCWGLTRFLEEARILARFDHPHVVRVHRVLETRGTAYLVTEYVEGPGGKARSLAAELREVGTLPESRVRELLDALVSGLEQVHAAGLMHRDIKPANVMLRANGSPVLIDFGAARHSMGRHSRSVTSVLTPGYAPIEQYSTKGDQGPWTDIYALGAVAFKALTGRVPDEATDRLRDDQLPPVAAVSRHPLSAGFASAVDSALAFDERSRPQSLREWRALLDRDGPADAARASRTVPGRRKAVSGSRRSDQTPREQVHSAGQYADTASIHAAPPQAQQSDTSRPSWLPAALVSATLVVGLVMVISGGRDRGSPDPAPQPPPPVVPAPQPPPPVVPAPQPPPPVVPDPRQQPREPTTAEETEVGLGLSRAARRAVQEGLIAAGFSPGTPDGIFGARTRTALTRWQAERGVAATGYLTAADADALRNVFPPTTDDHGDTRQTATVVALESSTLGVLEEEEDTDYFRVEVAAPGSLLVETTGRTDTIGRLVGTELAIDRDDNSDDDLNFRIRSIVSQGTYHIRVRGFDGIETGSYLLNVSFETATSIELGRTAGGVLETPDDFDTFTFEVPTAGVLTVETTGDTDTIGGLDCAPEVTAFDDDSGVSLNFQIRQHVEPGFCMVTVNGFEAGRYTLYVSHESGDFDLGTIDYGDDSSEWANDGECDDTRFTGADEYIGIEFNDDHVRRDASDCRRLFNQGLIRFRL